jgi:hypothetical protein
MSEAHKETLRQAFLGRLPLLSRGASLVLCHPNITKFEQVTNSKDENRGPPPDLDCLGEPPLPAKEVKLGVGFPWILSSDSSLFSGYGQFSAEIFSRPFLGVGGSVVVSIFYISWSYVLARPRDRPVCSSIGFSSSFGPLAISADRVSSSCALTYDSRRHETNTNR